MLAAGFLALSSAALLPGYLPQLPCRAGQPAASARVSAVGMSEDSEPETIFTLQERADGWDDVRNSIKQAKKDRSGAWEDIQRDYLKPTAAWTKVITTEIKEIVVDKRDVLDMQGVVTPTKPPAAPSPSPPPLFSSRAAPAPTAPPKEQPASFANQLMGSVASVLDTAVTTKQKQQQKAKPPPAPARATKPIEAKSGAVATANVALVYGLPLATLVGALLIATA